VIEKSIPRIWAEAQAGETSPLECLEARWQFRFDVLDVRVGVEQSNGRVDMADRGNKIAMPRSASLAGLAAKRSCSSCERLKQHRS
jgi:hypothetical protein